MRFLLPLFLLLAACGNQAPLAPDAGKPKPDGFYGDDLPVDTGDAGTDGGTPDAGPPCVGGNRMQVVLDCLNAGRSPNQCTLEQGNVDYCDTDRDGLFDDLEFALARAYAPVFAFNGGVWGGNPETSWPANAKHFVEHARLIYRVDGQAEQLVNAGPTLDTIWQAFITQNGTPLRAYDPSSNAGSNFWLCLNDTSSSTRVLTRADMLALPDGVDVVSVVHPANGSLAASTHLFISTSLFFAYNEFSGLDNHEGDWETVTVFVNRQTGAVDSAYFDRHSSTDQIQFVDVATYGAKNPATEGPATAVSSSDPAVHGLRFWDYSGNRHHVVTYVGTGAHALYDYPGNTAITSGGPRDTHDGDADKFAPWTGALYPGYSTANPTAVKTVFINPGEPGFITLNWARFKGQWGCDNELVAKSWPGPFGNARHPRPTFERTWGSPPVAPP